MMKIGVSYWNGTFPQLTHYKLQCSDSLGDHAAIGDEHQRQSLKLLQKNEYPAFTVAVSQQDTIILLRPINSTWKNAAQGEGVDFVDVFQL
jgi:hypothetical protein